MIFLPIAILFLTTTVRPTNGVSDDDLDPAIKAMILNGFDVKLTRRPTAYERANGYLNDQIVTLMLQNVLSEFKNITDQLNELVISLALGSAFEPLVVKLGQITEMTENLFLMKKIEYFEVYLGGEGIRELNLTREERWVKLLTDKSTGHY